MLPEVRLDTDSFKSLIEEYRMQIASIFPEWTNYNYSDPGMTLVELFAWMKENQQFYMEQLSPEHYMAFFRLMGIKQHKMIPAEIIAGRLSSESDEEFIPKGTVYYADGVPYTTMRDNFIPGIEIIGVRTGSYLSDEKPDVMGTMNIRPFGDNPTPGDTMEIFMDNPIPVNQTFNFAVILKIEPKRNLLNKAPFRMLTELGFEYYSAEGWKEIEKVNDFTWGLLFSGRLELTIESPMVEFDEGKYAIRIVLKGGKYDKVPCITNIGFPFIRLRQICDAECCSKDEGVLIGEGNGFPSQRIRLPYDGVMCESVEISVEDILIPGMIRKWKRVGDFSSETPYSECFMVDEAAGEVVFGDGRRGLPPEGKIILNKAKLCRGFDGTAMRGASLVSEGRQQLRVLSTPVIGKNTESIEDLKTRAKMRKVPVVLSTVIDYETQILKTPGMVIDSCKVLPSLSSPTKVTIAVRPGDGKSLMKLSEQMEENIYNHLDSRRLVGTQIKIVSPEYIKVNMEISAIPSDHHIDVEKNIKDSIEEYFDSYGTFGDYIEYGKLFGILDSLDCVERLIRIDFDPDKVSVIKSKGGDLIPPPNGLFVCGDIKISFSVLEKKR